jgi:hypothetical protein
MITFCFNGRAKAFNQDDFGLLLSVVEGEAVKGLRETRRRAWRSRYD